MAQNTKHVLNVNTFFKFDIKLLLFLVKKHIFWKEYYNKKNYY